MSDDDSALAAVLREAADLLEDGQLHFLTVSWPDGVYIDGERLVIHMESGKDES